MAKFLAVDASVVAKWFKKGESREEQAQRLRGEVLSSSLRITASELMGLEVGRGLIKAGYPKKKVLDAYSVLREMGKLGFIETVPVSRLVEAAKRFIVDLHLYVADAITLAAAESESSGLLTEDKHLLKAEVRAVARARGRRVLDLGELYAQPT